MTSAVSESSRLNTNSASSPSILCKAAKKIQEAAESALRIFHRDPGPIAHSFIVASAILACPLAAGKSFFTSAAFSLVGLAPHAILSLTREKTLIKAFKERDAKTVLAILKEDPSLAKKLRNHRDSNGTTFFQMALRLAVLEKDPEALRILLQESTPEEKPETLLHSAVLGEDARIIRMLLSKGWDPNSLDWYRNSPLHQAIYLKNPDLAKILLELGASPNLENPNGDSPLHMVVLYQSLEIAELLLKQKACVDKQTSLGITPLRLAASQGNLAMMKLFLNYGASPAIPDNSGVTPLHSAILGGRKEVVLLILEAAEKNPSFLLFLFQRTNTGNNPIDLAILKEDSEMQALLTPYFIRAKKILMNQMPIKIPEALQPIIADYILPGSYPDK